MRASRLMMPALLATCGLVASAVSRAALFEGPVVLEQPLGALLANPILRVSEAGDEGTIKLEVRPEYKQFTRFGSLFTEGHYLLLTGSAANPDSVRLLRARIDDIASGPVFTVSVGPKAARTLKTGDLVSLLRPPQSTTAQLKGLPDVIPIDNKAPKTGGAAGPVGGVAEGLATMRRAAQRAQSTNNLKQIGLAMHNYHSAMNSFPPGVVFGPDGKPRHSWRVLILPYLEQQPLYNAYDFNEPWDSAKNIKLLDKMPSVYRDPVYGDAKGHFTHYAALVGPNTAFPASGAKQEGANSVPLDKGKGIRDFTDGTSNTILVVPIAPDRKIPWTKPEDLTVGANFPAPGAPGGMAAPYTAGPGQGAARIAPVLFADGSVRTISDKVNPQVLKAVTTISGGEVVAHDALDAGVGAAAAMPRPAQQTLKIRIDGGKATATIE